MVHTRGWQWEPHGMDQDSNDERRPTTDQPLNAEPRPTLTPMLAVIGLIVAIGLVFLLITWVRYNT
jgi:hypothetical protein